MSVTSPVFPLSHTVTYEIISATNGKYIVFKLVFPRVGDTMFTVDKLMDINVWKELYNVLQRISLDYVASGSSLPPQLIDKNRYKLLFEKIEMSSAHLRDIFNVDKKLVAATVCVDLVLINNATMNRNLSIASSSVHDSEQITDSLSEKNRPVRMNNTKRKSDDLSSEDSDGDSHIKINHSPNIVCSSSDSSSSDNKSSPDSKKRKIQPSLQSSKRPLNSVANITDSISKISKIQSPKQPTTSSSYSIVHPEKHQLPQKSTGHISLTSIADSDSDLSSDNSSSYKKLFVPQNLNQLHTTMSDSQYMKRFGYEMNQVNESKDHRFFDAVYSLDDVKTNNYAAFHSSKIIETIGGQKDCKLFFYFCPNLLQLCKNFSKVKMNDVNHVLMVFWSYLGNAFPFAVFLLRDNHDSLRPVPKVINNWLQNSTTVIGCTTPYNLTLQRSIAEVWPQAEIWGCSTEYHNEINDFAMKNERFKIDSKLTRLARSLCYLGEQHFSAGIKVIRKYTASDYDVKLTHYLRTKWLGILKSIRKAEIVHRSLAICEQFSNQIGRDQCFEHIWEFIDFLRQKSNLTIAELRANHRNSNFELTTERQKERQRRYHRASAEFDMNVKVMPIFDAVETFMLEITEKFPLQPMLYEQTE